MIDVAAYLASRRATHRWLARRFERTVWSAEDLEQAFALRVCELAPRCADEEQLSAVLFRALPRHARRLILGDRGNRDASRRPWVALDIDLSERVIDPAWALPFLRSEVLREVDRVLGGVERAVARGVLDPPEAVRRATLTRLSVGGAKTFRYVTVGDVAAGLGVTRKVARGALGRAVARLAEAAA